MPPIYPVARQDVWTWYDVVLSSFQVKDLGIWCRNNNISFEELTEYRTRFLMGGFSGLLNYTTKERWIQIETELTDDPDCSRLLTFSFISEIETFLSQRKVRNFAFLHKPPGLRLRFLTSDPDFKNEIGHWFHPIAPGAWQFGCYEPEVYQFGGAEGLAIAHDFFTLDSLAILKYRYCMKRERHKLFPHEFSLLLLQQLVGSATEDRWEEWDVWCGQTLTGRLSIDDLITCPENLDALRNELLPLLHDEQIARRRMSEEEADIFESWASSMPRLTAGLREAARAGKSFWSVRQVLPFWAIHHWNRMGFDYPFQRRIATLMSAVLNPKW